MRVSINAAIRCVVHNSVRYPCAIAPLVNRRMRRAFCGVVSLDGRPDAGLALSASGPPDPSASRHRSTLLALQPIRRAISCRDSFCLRNAMTFRRRSSKDRGEPRGLMETPPFRMPPLYCITYADVNIEFSDRDGAVSDPFIFFFLSCSDRIHGAIFHIVTCLAILGLF